ncbi:MAG: acetyl-CoA C-acetyltransferase [Fibrobacteria bacterium]|nr:acetyl-CoA C-acetyltransferase [Fibrobacteria bacterium]
MFKVIATGAVRTPIGELSGSFSNTSAVELGVCSAKASLKLSGIQAKDIDEVVFGNVLQCGQGQNPARQISIGADIPQEIPAYTVNKVCGSGMKAVELGWQNILLNRSKAVLAGGTENMTMAPYLLPAMRLGSRLGDSSVIDSVVLDGLTDVFGKYHMGITAENIAERYDISREEQDEFALNSHKKYAAAFSKGLFKDEITDVTIKVKRKDKRVDTDEHPRLDITLEGLGKLRPAFKKDGTVTAGNASGINDAGTSLVLASEGIFSGLNTEKAVVVRDFASCGCSPEVMGLGPVGAVNKLLKNNNLTVKDIKLWELNEAFSVQALAVVHDLRINPEIVNVNGGAVSLGHPIGASGARIMVTLIHEMKRSGVDLAVASLCIGGGMGIAVLLENL